MAHHTHPSSFNWQSDLSDERKNEIILWVASLDGNQQKCWQKSLRIRKQMRKIVLILICKV